MLQNLKIQNPWKVTQKRPRISSLKIQRGGVDAFHYDDGAKKRK